MAEKVSNEEAFLSSLEDAIAVVQGLSTHCDSVDDLLAVLKLAKENESQLRFLMSVITRPVNNKSR